MTAVQTNKSTFTLPDLGEGLIEAEIVAWHVEEGESVVADQPMVSVETDKAVVEIPAPYPGVVTKRYGKVGEAVKVDAPLVDMEGAEHAPSVSVVGELPEASEGINVPDHQVSGLNRPTVKATPAVRALARKMGVDLSAVAPSGPGGSITADDVRRVSGLLAEVAPPEPLKGVRRAMARKMAQAHSEVASTSVWDEANIHGWAEDEDVTVRLIYAIAKACKAEPALNSWFESDNMSRRLRKTIDLGIAVDTDDGLFVPVVRDAGNRSPEDLRSGLETMRKDIESRSIPHEEMRGATITLSNFGTFGAGKHAALVVVPPQVAIIGAGRIEEKVCAVDGEVCVHRFLPLSLTFDHRVVTGGEASRFLHKMILELTKTKKVVSDFPPPPSARLFDVLFSLGYLIPRGDFDGCTNGGLFGAS